MATKKRSPRLPAIRDEDHLWELIRPRLRGWWRRLETVTPDGLPDCIGLWNLSTQWIELKVGKPGLNALRPAQRDFGYERMRYGIPVWTCFGYKGRVLFFLDFNFEVDRLPPFYRA